MFAQGNERVVMQGIPASSLSGIVRAPDRRPLGNVSVMLFACPAGEFRGLAEPNAVLAAKSDASGSFHLDWHKGKRACLQFQTLGFDTLQMEVRRSRFAGKLKPVLRLGT